MAIFLVIGAALAIGLMRGGNLGNFSNLRFRWQPLIWFGFLIQVIIYSNFWDTQTTLNWINPYAYIFSLVLLVLALALNYKIPGMWLIAVGFFCNFITIVLNGGYMPASPEAFILAGHLPLAPSQISHNSIGAGPDTRLGFLGDILAIPKGFPFSNVFSIGDVLIAIGAIVLIQKTMVTPSASQK